eukprot:2694569-Amphidinium_carterae.1
MRAEENGTTMLAGMMAKKWNRIAGPPSEAWPAQCISFGCCGLASVGSEASDHSQKGIAHAHRVCLLGFRSGKFRLPHECQSLIAYSCSELDKLIHYFKAFWLALLCNKQCYHKQLTKRESCQDMLNILLTPTHTQNVWQIVRFE